MPRPYLTKNDRFTMLFNTLIFVFVKKSVILLVDSPDCCRQAIQGVSIYG